MGATEQAKTQQSEITFWRLANKRGYVKAACNETIGAEPSRHCDHSQRPGYGGLGAKGHTKLPSQMYCRPSGQQIGSQSVPWPLSWGHDGLQAILRSYQQFAPRLKFSVLQIGLLRIHAGKDGFAHLAFGLHGHE